MSTSPTPMNVAIVGEGLDAAMAAAVLARGLPGDRFRISVVPGGEPPAFASIETSLASIRGFHAALGIAEEAVLRAASGSFSLGTAYSGWARPGTAYFAPLGDVGSALGGVAFHQLAQRLRQAGERVRLADYSLAAMLAQTGRFARPLDDPRSPLSTYSYGLHVDRRGYADLLFALAEREGAVRNGSPFRSAERGDEGSIARLNCADGTQLEADVFIDASGASALLAGSEGAEFQSWREWLPWDSAVEIESTSEVPPAAYALITAEAFGWRRAVPGRVRVGECLVYASDRLTDVDASSRLISGAVGTPATEPRLTRFEAGRLAEPWHGNRIAVGAAAARLEPTAATSLHLLQSQLEHLVQLFPGRGGSEILRREFNRLTCQELDRTRDFVILRYKLNGRVGEPIWDELRAMSVPDELAHKMAEYARRGQVPMFDGDLFEEIEWAMLFDEHGVTPARYDLLADSVPLDQLKAQFARMRQVMLQSIGNVPLHGDYLAKRQRSAAA